MKKFTIGILKKITLYLTTLAAILAVSGCDVAKGLAGWSIAMARVSFSPDPKDQPFPLGEHKQITIDINNYSWKKPYIVSLKMVYPGGDKRPDKFTQIEPAMDKCPYRIRIQVFQKKGEQYQHIESRIETHAVYGMSGHAYGDHPDDWAEYVNLGKNMDLPVGQYRFVITDESEPIAFYSEIKTYISVGVNKRIG